MPFTVKQWKNKPDQSTPISAAGLVDLEQRLSAYVDTMLPVGVPLPWVTASAPSGFTIYDGKAISRGGNPVLWSIFGTTFGSGDGSTTFSLPDLRGLTLVGVGGTLNAALWNRPGSGPQNGGSPSITLGVAEMPRHHHAGSTVGYRNPAHYHPFGGWMPYSPNGWAGTFSGNGPVNGIYTDSGLGNLDRTANADINHDHPLTVVDEGSGGSHNNMPPYFAIYWMTRLG